MAFQLRTTEFQGGLNFEKFQERFSSNKKSGACNYNELSLKCLLFIFFLDINFLIIFHFDLASFFKNSMSFPKGSFLRKQRSIDENDVVGVKWIVNDDRFRNLLILRLDVQPT